MEGHRLDGGRWMVGDVQNLILNCSGYYILQIKVNLYVQSNAITEELTAEWTNGKTDGQMNGYE